HVQRWCLAFHVAARLELTCHPDEEANALDVFRTIANELPARSRGQTISALNTRCANARELIQRVCDDFPPGGAVWDEAVRGAHEIAEQLTHRRCFVAHRGALSRFAAHAHALSSVMEATPALFDAADDFVNNACGGIFVGRPLAAWFLCWRLVS